MGVAESRASKSKFHKEAAFKNARCRLDHSSGDVRRPMPLCLLSCKHGHIRADRRLDHSGGDVRRPMPQCLLSCKHGHSRADRGLDNSSSYVRQPMPLWY